MIESIICLVTAFLGFMVVFLIGIGYKSNRNTNFYLILVFLITSIRFLFHGTTSFSIISISYQRQIDFIYIITATPLSYLYFINLVRTNNILKKSDLLHFIIPIILFSLKNYFNYHNVFVGLKIGFFVLMFFNIGYVIAAYLFLKEKVWKRKSNIFVINQQNNIINNWTKLLFSFYLLIFVRFFLNLLLNDNAFWYLNNNNFLWLGGLIWIIMYIKILYSPEFLYGYEVFQNKIKEYKKHDVIFDNIWILDNNVEVTNIQDSNLKEKMDGNVRNYIQQIENQALNGSLFFAKKFDIPILATSLKIPNSHLNYLFKYHSAISFPEFKKIIRIQRSVLLINEGFLKKSTFDFLATEIGFSSYSAFFKSFKNIIGKSPQEYCNQLNIKQ